MREGTFLPLNASYSDKGVEFVAEYASAQRQVLENVEVGAMLLRQRSCFGGRKSGRWRRRRTNMEFCRVHDMSCPATKQFDFVV